MVKIADRVLQAHWDRLLADEGLAPIRERGDWQHRMGLGHHSLSHREGYYDALYSRALELLHARASWHELTFVALAADGWSTTETAEVTGVTRGHVHNTLTPHIHLIRAEALSDEDPAGTLPPNPSDAL